ncbi:MAG TPA: LysR substrate-binding domain-containing protein [Steroidobacteraceae bacterium]|jgi:DNA-binding transcriptional LysR family regulator
MYMELRKLRYFLVAAEEGNFRKAAARLHVTQPSLSQQIHELEEELGVLLFDRLPRGVRLSGAGLVFFSEAGKLLARLTEAIDRTRRTGSGEFGILRIAFSELGAQQRTVAQALHNFKRSSPDVTLDLLALNSAAQLGALRKGEIDAGFCHLADTPEDGVEALVLDVDRYVLAISKFDAVMEKRELSTDDLVGQTIIWAGPRGDSKAGDSTTRQFRDRGMPISKIIKTGSDGAALNLASVGMGIGLVLSSQRMFPSEALEFRDLPGPPWRLKSALAWQSDNRSRQLSRFIEVVKRVTQEHGSCPGTSEAKKQPEI